MTDKTFNSIRDALYDLQKQGITVSEIEEIISFSRDNAINSYFKNIGDDTGYDNLVDDAQVIVPDIYKILEFCFNKSVEFSIPLSEVYKFISSLVVDSIGDFEKEMTSKDNDSNDSDKCDEEEEEDTNIEKEDIMNLIESLFK